MSWITNLLKEVGTYGSEFISPENLAKSLGTAGVMSLFGGNSDDFARNFLMTNLGRTIGGVEKNKRPTAKSLNQKFLKLNPAEQQKYIDNFTSGNLNNQDFDRYMELFGKSGFTFEDYQKNNNLNKRPLGSMPGQNYNNMTPGIPYESPYGTAMNASFNPDDMVPVSGGDEVAEVINYDPSGLFSSPEPEGIATVEKQGQMGTDFTQQTFPDGSRIITNPATGKQVFINSANQRTILEQAAKKAPGFGEGIGFFADRLKSYPQQELGQRFLEAMDPDYYKKRDYQQEAEDRDKKLRNQFRQETLNPSRAGFSRTMRPRRYASGGIADLQSGGAANGPGTGTSDSIPARLSDGEFVMTAEAVRNMGNGSRAKGTRKMYDLMNNLERRM
ncbi:hypothetical protein N9909_00455 [bacterium]|nr:hypothetical protein [bacterium]